MDSNVLDDIIDITIDELFVVAHQEFGTKSGDITPEQSFRLDEIKEELSKLMSEQIKQNL